MSKVGFLFFFGFKRVLCHTICVAHDDASTTFFFIYFFFINIYLRYSIYITPYVLTFTNLLTSTYNDLHLLTILTTLETYVLA